MMRATGASEFSEDACVTRPEIVARHLCRFVCICDSPPVGQHFSVSAFQFFSISEPIFRPAVATLLLATATFARAADVVQLDVSSVLNGRPVTTYDGHHLTPWREGVDGDGTADGLLTGSAARAKGDPSVHALPDSPLIPASAQHPAIALHYANADATGKQARGLTGRETLSLAIPDQSFAKLYLVFTSAEGPTNIRATLHYADGTTTNTTVEIPDWYNATGKDPRVSVAVGNLAKWNAQGALAESDHHYLHAVELAADPTRRLTKVEVAKLTPASYLVFWAAAAVK